MRNRCRCLLDNELKGVKQEVIQRKRKGMWENPAQYSGEQECCECTEGSTGITRPLSFEPGARSRATRQPKEQPGGRLGGEKLGNPAGTDGTQTSAAD